MHFVIPIAFTIFPPIDPYLWPRPTPAINLTLLRSGIPIGLYLILFNDTRRLVRYCISNFVTWARVC